MPFLSAASSGFRLGSSWPFWQRPSCRRRRAAGHGPHRRSGDAAAGCRWSCWRCSPRLGRGVAGFAVVAISQPDFSAGRAAAPPERPQGASARWPSASFTVLYSAAPRRASAGLRCCPETRQGIAAAVLSSAPSGSETPAPTTWEELRPPQMSPRISPNKTWEGLAGGMPCDLRPQPPSSSALRPRAGLLVHVLGPGRHSRGHRARRRPGGVPVQTRHRRQGLVARCFPGHGGFLDRTDSLLYSRAHRSRLSGGRRPRCDEAPGGSRLHRSIGTSTLAVVEAFPDDSRRWPWPPDATSRPLREQIRRHRPGVVSRGRRRRRRGARRGVPRTSASSGARRVSIEVACHPMRMPTWWWPPSWARSGWRRPWPPSAPARTSPWPTRRPWWSAGELIMAEVAEGRSSSAARWTASTTPSTRPERRSDGRRRALVLTASGGPFRPWSGRAHGTGHGAATPSPIPPGSMGPKITVDSATMMNKGLRSSRPTTSSACPRNGSTSWSTRRAWFTRWWSTWTAPSSPSCRSTTCGFPILYALSWPERLPAHFRRSTSSRMPVARLSRRRIHDRFPALDWRGRPCAPAARCRRCSTPPTRWLSRLFSTDGAAFRRYRGTVDGHPRWVERGATGRSRDIDQALAADRAKLGDLPTEQVVKYRPVREIRRARVAVRRNDVDRVFSLSFFVLGVLVMLHEAGHFLVARLLGAPVEVFSVGFGKRLWGFERGGTDYRLSAVPARRLCADHRPRPGRVRRDRR